MTLGGDEINQYKKTRLWLLFLNFGVIFAYGAILFFTDWEIIKYPGASVALGYAVIYIIFHFISNFFIEKSPNYIFELSVFLISLYFLIVIDYFGGPTGFFAFFILYVIILWAMLYKTLWGAAYTAVSIITILISGLLIRGDLLLIPLQYAITVVPALASAVIGYFLNLRNQAIQKDNQKLKIIADKLTAEKSQDEAVLTSIADGVYAVDRERNIVLLNRAAQNMVGWEQKDALGIKCKTVMKLIGGESNVSICEKDCPALAVWNTGQPVFRNDTCFIHHQNKNRIQLSSSYAPIKDLDGDIVGAICVFRDFTKEKELERQRNEFVSTASHELRTPITATEGYLSIISDSGICKIDDNGKKYLEKAKNTLLSMSALVKNLLSVTKIEEGQLQVSITNFSIKELIEEVVDVFSFKANEKGIKISLFEAGDITKGGGKKIIGRKLNVRADREMIREVLYNLIENAIKFTETGSVTLSVDFDNEFATVNVADTGAGIPEEAQKHLFEKFYRADNTATREVGGTGLGLYITRSIIEKFGGKIWVESTLSKGSTFKFTIPMALDS